MEIRYLFLRVVLMVGSLVAVIYAMNLLKQPVMSVPQVRSATVIKLQSPTQAKDSCDEKTAQKGVCQ